MRDERGRLPSAAPIGVHSATAVGIGRRTNDFTGNAGDGPLSSERMVQKRSGFLRSVSKFVKDLASNEFVEIGHKSPGEIHSFKSVFFSQDFNKVLMDSATADLQWRPSGNPQPKDDPLGLPTAAVDAEKLLSYMDAGTHNPVQLRGPKQVHLTGFKQVGVQRREAPIVPKGSGFLKGAPMVELKDVKKADEPSETKMKEVVSSRFLGENAIAGGLAGVFVSLCLHPLDTVKTVLQSRSVGSRTVFSIVSTIASERGVTGFYRGLGSNLASSAPISAIYTFTYESVKAALLPHVSPEHQYIAHCAAGGCASIATSLVYTPSEHVKQQMQVGSVYRNSGMALIGILRKGGPVALYAGWGAVLCRNVPQSIIKFFTYEALKQRALAGCPSDSHLSTLQTLAFGGIAGSTAALFTTPFDVVKTRLQTQAVGSPNQYSNVLHALQQIAANEGLSSLYRGLVPRLAIYVSQGALFFASYELFKRALAVEYRIPPIVASRQKPAECGFGRSER